MMDGLMIGRKERMGDRKEGNNGWMDDRKEGKDG